MCLTVYSQLLVFFFKQKTAYEMRISDWSSDVCSSDLRTAPVQRWTPAIALKVVVLPAPFGPIRPTISPASTESATSRTARCSPKRTLRSCTLSSAIRAYLSVHRCGELGQGLHQLDVVVLADRKSTRLNSSH